MYENPASPIENLPIPNVPPTTQTSSLMGFYLKYKKQIFTFSNIVMVLITLFLARNNFYDCGPDAMFNFWHSWNAPSPTQTVQVSNVSPSPITYLSPTETNSYVTTIPSVVLTPTIETVQMSETPSENKQIVLDKYKCNGDKYIDFVLDYEINCPAGFWVITTMAEGSFFGDLPQKRQNICEGGQVNPDNVNDCLKGGIEILSNIDGKGGSCDDDHYETILVNGKQSSFCWSDDKSSFSQLSTGDTEHKFGKSDFWIGGSPSKTFTKTELFEMLQSFKSL